MSRELFRRLNLVGAAAVLAALIGLALLDVAPGAGGIRVLGTWQLPELCLVKSTTGAPCPSCGLGRSLVLAAHGQAGPSLGVHPGGLVLVVWLLAQGLWRVGAAIFAGMLLPWARVDLLVNAALMLAAFGAAAALGHW